MLIQRKYKFSCGFLTVFQNLTIFKQTFGLKSRKWNSMQHFLLQGNGILADLM